MTFLRRGNVSFPHRPKASITVHRVGDYPFQIRLAVISCFEEYESKNGFKWCKVFFTNGSNIIVNESFDDINAACRAWEVANV